MSLYKMKDYYPNYRDSSQGTAIADIDQYNIYTEGENRVGSAKDILVDQSGRFRYIERVMVVPMTVSLPSMA